MSCRFVLLATAFAGCLTASGAAIAENRLALVIGNSAYQSAPALPNPVNDAKAVTELLQSAGFRSPAGVRPHAKRYAPLDRRFRR